VNISRRPNRESNRLTASAAWDSGLRRRAGPPPRGSVRGVPARGPHPPARGAAWFGGLLATDVAEASVDPAVLDRGGWWAVVATFEEQYRFWRFRDVRPAPLPPGGRWHGPSPSAWSTSLDRQAYVDGVREIRRRVREGAVYQVNLCRVLSAPLPPDADPWSLAGVLAEGNPAPFAGVVDTPDLDGVPAARLVSASPELFLARHGDVVRSSPIKGTGVTAADLRSKDEAENVMIVDLVRNDLQRVCRPGTVEVTALLVVEQHPGLVHLVSTVEGDLSPGRTAYDVLQATFPAGTLSGAPKPRAMEIIDKLEPVRRGLYGGVVGYLDVAGDMDFAIAIRTALLRDGVAHVQAGAGIVADSVPEREDEECRNKAAAVLRAVATASTLRPAGGPAAGGPPTVGGPGRETQA